MLTKRDAHAKRICTASNAWQGRQALTARRTLDDSCTRVAHMAVTPQDIGSTTVGYDAFICHRRSDGGQAAALLKRRLRAYRLPKRVPDDPALVRPTSARPLEIFLDADEERTSQDYWEDHIRPALDASRKVIVLWTKDSVQRRPGWDPMWAEVDHVV